MKENIANKINGVKQKLSENSQVFQKVESKWATFDNSKRIVTVIIVVVLLWMLSGVFKFGHKNGEQKPAGVAIVKTEINNASSKDVYIKLNGITLADQIVHLKSEVEGLIVDIPSKNARFVKKGETLAIVDQKNRIKAVEQAEAELKKQRVSYNAAKAIFEKKLSSEVALVTAKSNLLSAEARLQATLDELDKTFIKAPFDGYLNSIDVDVGEFVTTVNGINIGSIAILDPMNVIVYIPEKDIQTAQLAKTADVVFGESVLEGNITSLAKVAENDTRSFKMEIKVPNKELILNSGQSVVVRVHVSKTQAHQVPKSVITLDVKGNIIVKVLNEQNEVVELKADIIDEDEDGFWLGGLPDTINLITLGHQFVNNGEKVEVGK